MQRSSRLPPSHKHSLPLAGCRCCVESTPAPLCTSIGRFHHPFRCLYLTHSHPCTTNGLFHPINYIPITCTYPFTGYAYANTSAHVAIRGDDVRRLLDDCSATKDVASSRKLQLWMVCNGLDSFPLYGDHLIRLFASCTALPLACQVFLKVAAPNAYTWNAIISAHAQLSHREQALALYFKMQEVGVEADRVTFLCILKVYSSNMASLARLHMMICEMGFDSDTIIGSTLVHMYGKSGSLEDAQKVFDSLPNPNVVAYGALITGYAQYGNGMHALQLFEDMQAQGLQPGKAIFLGVLKACGKARITLEGQVIHDQIIRAGLHADIAITSALVDMYGKCARFLDSRKLFKDLPNLDVVAWASFISSYTHQGNGDTIVNLLEDMEQGGIVPDEVIFLCVVKACADLAADEQGRIIHDHIIKVHHESIVVLANSLVDMYAKNGRLEEAQHIFNRLETRNLVSCSAMIAGYAQEQHGVLACFIFDKMQDDGIEPDRVSYLGVLKACTSLGAIRKGRQIHKKLIEASLDGDVGLGNTLINMYAKCGSVGEAHSVFDRLSNRDMVSWHAIISGYAQQGDCLLAMILVDSMQHEGFKLDSAVYMSVLAGCSYAGLVKEGRTFFENMMQGHNISPLSMHYNCMIDLLGRTGCLDDANDMLKAMPGASNLIGWSALHSVCKAHINMNIGMQCFSEIVQLDPQEASCYMTMSSLYASSQRIGIANQVQTLRKQKQVWKKPGEAWIEVGTRVHEFVVNDRLSQDDTCLAKSIRIASLVKEKGYLPDLEMLFESRMTT